MSVRKTKGRFADMVCGNLPLWRRHELAARNRNSVPDPNTVHAEASKTQDTGPQMAALELGSQLVGEPLPSLGAEFSNCRDCGRGGTSLHQTGMVKRSFDSDWNSDRNIEQKYRR